MPAAKCQVTVMDDWVIITGDNPEVHPQALFASEQILIAAFRLIRRPSFAFPERLSILKVIDTARI